MPASIQISVLGLLLGASQACALSSFIGASLYIVEWMHVNDTVRGDWYANTSVAQQEIIAVVNKTLLPPSGDIHDYYSLSPYWWPDCSNVHNTTVLTEQQISTECDYVVRDGQFNPDRTIVNDTGAFATLSTAVFYNVLAWRITGQDAYADAAAGFIDTWFLNNATAMNPNLEYSQVIRGPDGSKTGTHLGVLDLHCFTKIASAIQVMRDAKAAAWTSTRDSAMVAWTQDYLTWLLTSPISLGEKNSTNNHGTFWYAQAASVHVLVGNLTGATTTLHEYFDGIYKNQINATGDQPLEAVRTLPFHYRAYNSGGILCINRIAEYLGWNAWNITTTAGTDIQDAVDFSMTLTDAENNDPSELFPNVAAVASHYGDPSGRYAAYLTQHNPTYPGEAWFFWDQPFSNSGINVTLDSGGSILLSNGTVTNSTTATGGGSKSAAFDFQPSVGLGLATLVMLGASLWFAL